MDTLAEESHPKKVGRQAAVVQSFLLSGHDREPSIRRMAAYYPPHRFRLRLETESRLEVLFRHQDLNESCIFLSINAFLKEES